jgi:hypothetical protein
MSEGSAPTPSADDPIPPAPLRLARWSLVALLVFGSVAASIYSDLWQGDPSQVVLATATFDEAAPEGRQAAWRHSTFADTAFVAWLVSRHANTLLTRPQRLLDTEHCYPAEKSIAFGEPMLTMGLLATPARLFGAGPLLAYNSAVLLVAVMGALAMFLLVVDWSGSAPAGLAAGLLYAFHPVQLIDVSHRFIYDMAWTALALLFAQRLCAGGRFRDAVGLAVCIVLQSTASSYALSAAVFFATPVGVWLLLRRAPMKIRPRHVVLVVVVVATSMALVFGPYLDVRDTTGLLRRSVQIFVSWGSFLPDGKNFPGWMVILLAAAGLALARDRVLPRIDGDPRLAIVIGGLLVALAAANGNHNAVAFAKLAGETPPPALPKLYGIVSSLVPGLDSVRAPRILSIGVHLALSLLAGLGAAGLLRLAPRLAPKGWSGALAGLMVLAAAGVALRPAWLGFEPSVRFETLAIRPSQEDRAFFTQLAEMNNTGPVAEYPVVRRTGIAAVEPILLSAWHGRKTSACNGVSFRPPALAEIEEIASRLPEREAVADLRARGFTTLVVHEIGRAPLAPAFREAAERGDSGLRFLLDSSRMSAFALEPRHRPGRPGSPGRDPLE